MNRLTSLVEDQTLRDDQGNQLAVRFEYNAPDRMRYHIANGPTAIQIGTDDYQLGPDGKWIQNRRALAVQWPDFHYARVGGGARIETEAMEQVPHTQVVAFEYGGFDFRVWIDTTTYRITRLTMDGPNHHMVTVYSAFDSAPAGTRSSSGRKPFSRFSGRKQDFPPANIVEMW